MREHTSISVSMLSQITGNSSWNASSSFCAFLEYINSHGYPGLICKVITPIFYTSYTYKLKKKKKK